MVEEGLEKVEARPWATPLSKALAEAVDGFIPGSNIIQGALSFGALFRTSLKMLDANTKRILNKA